MRAVVFFLLLAPPAVAQSLEATRTLRAQHILTEDDIRIGATETTGALSDPSEALGLEVRATIYAGRPIRPEDLAPAAVVERNQLVPLEFRIGGLTITAQGRALARAGAGQTIRALNLDSRTVVTGRVSPDGQILVGSAP